MDPQCGLFTLGAGELEECGRCVCEDAEFMRVVDGVYVLVADEKRELYAERAMSRTILFAGVGA